MSNGGFKMKQKKRIKQKSTKLKIGADFICRNKVSILVISAILFVLSIFGNFATKINYDILVYLPEDIETIEGQNILTDQFDMGAYSIVLTENMTSRDILKLEEEFRKIKGVNQVVGIYDAIGTTIPIEILPNEITSKINQDDTDLMFVTFEESTSSLSTIDAIREMKKVASNIKISGMSAMVLDTMDLSNKEIAIYVVIAVILCFMVLELSLDSYFVPLLLLGNIGIAIIFNLGSNILFGEISYITKALVAVLQLGVTTDFSIFLYHSYEKERNIGKDKMEAMSNAIVDTFTAVTGSSLTTIAGFLVLCTMNLTLGKDLGLVMAKGVLLGVISVLTIFPSLLLVFDKWIEKTRHKSITIHFEKINQLVVRHHKKILVVFLLLVIPFYLANSKVDVYYKLDESLPKTLDSIVANKELKEKFNIVSPEIILVNKDLKTEKEEEMVNRILEVEGVDFVLSFSKLKEMGITEDMLPKDLVSVFESENYQMLLLNSTYDIATTELNEQVEMIHNMIKEYDPDAILAGEGPLMKDLVKTSDEDFRNVNASSIICILGIMFIVLKSISLPFLLIASIEFAIFTNMSFSYFSGTFLPFIAPIVLGTIQLGATIDYAILMTTNYLKNRKGNMKKQEAILQAMNYSSNSIFVSGMCFFAATFGVGFYSKIEMIGSLCTLISRGAIISMIVVITVLPSILLVFDSLIMKTTYKEKGSKMMKKEKLKKIIATSLVIACSFMPVSTLALAKEETVYGKLNSDGSVKTLFVNEHLVNTEQLDSIEDYSDLEDIININSDSTYQRKDHLLTWDSKGKDIFYQGKTTKQIPVTIEITYRLNGEEIELQNLIGKKGHVEISLKYKNQDAHSVKINGRKETLYTPFVVAMTTMIPSTNNSNIKVSNGKVVDNGNGYMIVGLSSPGLYESLSLEEFKALDRVDISYDTEKFELASIYSVMTPKLIDSSDLDIFEKLGSLYGNIGKLQNSMNQIEEGSKTVLQGLTTIGDGANQIASNLQVVLEKLEEIKNGAVSIEEGLTQILNQLTVVKESLTGSENLEKLSKMQALIQQNEQTITSLQGKLKELKEAYDSYSLENIIYEDLLATNLELYQVKYNYEHNYDANLRLLTLLTTNNEALKTSLETLETSSHTISSLVDTLNGYLVKLEEGASKLSNGTNALKEGVSLLNSKMNELVNGTSVLANGMTTLDSGIVTFNQEGIQTLTGISVKISRLSSKIEALMKLGNNYQTVSLSQKGVEENTKFILVVDGVKAPKEENKVKEVKKTTFIDRIKNLFK